MDLKLRRRFQRLRNRRTARMLPASTSLRFYPPRTGRALFCHSSAKMDRFFRRSSFNSRLRRRLRIPGQPFRVSFIKFRALAGRKFGVGVRDRIRRHRLAIHIRCRGSSFRRNSAGKIFRIGPGGFSALQITPESEQTDDQGEPDDHARNKIVRLLLSLTNRTKASAGQQIPINPINFLATMAAKIRLVEHFPNPTVPREATSNRTSVNF